MFWGCVLKDGQPYQTQSTLEDGEFPVLHISNAVLPKNSKKEDGKVSIHISLKPTGESVAQKEIKNLCVAILDPNSKDQVALDLFINVQQNITISCQGKGEVHLSGYFEPYNQMEDGMFGPGKELDDYDEEEGEEDQEEISNEHKSIKQEIKQVKVKDIQGFEKGGDLEKSLQAAKKNAAKNAEPDSDDDSDSDDAEEEEEGEFNIDSDDIESQDIDSELAEDDSESSDELSKKILSRAKELQSKQKIPTQQVVKKEEAQEELQKNVQSKPKDSQQKQKPSQNLAVKKESSSEEDSDDSESEDDLATLLAKKKQLLAKPNLPIQKTVQQNQKPPHLQPDAQKVVKIQNDNKARQPQQNTFGQNKAQKTEEKQQVPQIKQEQNKNDSQHSNSKKKRKNKNK